MFERRLRCGCRACFAEASSRRETSHKSPRTLQTLCECSNWSRGSPVRPFIFTLSIATRQATRPQPVTRAGWPSQSRPLRPERMRVAPSLRPIRTAHPRHDTIKKDSLWVAYSFYPRWRSSHTDTSRNRISGTSHFLRVKSRALSRSLPPGRRHRHPIHHLRRPSAPLRPSRFRIRAGFQPRHARPSPTPFDRRPLPQRVVA